MGDADVKRDGFRGRIYDSVIDTIGDTPLIRLSRLAKQEGCKAEIVGKCEFFNPLSSVKDRIGIAMIEAAEAAGKLTPDTVIVEPTSGNTGIALAFACAIKGYRLIVTLPDSMSLEKRKMLELLNAEVVLTPAEEGMPGAISRAEHIMTKHSDTFMPQQFSNPANPEIHRLTTAEEIWRDTNGQVDVVVSGVGTGGTLTGVGRVIKERKPELRMIAVEPENNAVLSGDIPGAHKIQGIGAGFIPVNLDPELVDEVVKVNDESAFSMARKVIKIEGLPIGITSGAAVVAALEVGRRADMSGKMIVVILPSPTERYLSTKLAENLSSE
ncbi:MAG: cysteine synthase A [Rhodospirillaceae bacterium]|nr:cysteine synthase A [Rhodospirillaceae bacterium]